MTSLGLRLAALTNLKFQQIKNGDINDEEDIAYYIFQLSVKYWSCGGDPARYPLRLLDKHIDKLEEAQQRNTHAMARGLSSGHHNSTITKQLWRLEEFLTEFTKVVQYQLKQCSSRAEAALLCRIFSLGKEGLRIWEKEHFNARRTIPTAAVFSVPKLKTNNARKGTPPVQLKRKQPPTDITPQNLLPSPTATDTKGTGDVNQNPDRISVDDHDPPAFTRDTSITRSKSRFASKGASCTASAIATTSTTDSIAISNKKTGIVLSGATPPGEDEYAAADAMMTWHSGVEANKNAVAAAADGGADGGFEVKNSLKQKPVGVQGRGLVAGITAIENSFCSIT